MDEPRDEDLVRRFQGGDAGAFAALVHRHERRVYNLALRMTGREEDARDATQDAFLAALRKLHTFRGEAAFTTWMHRVTVNACYDLLRKRQRAPLSIEPAPAEADRPRAEPTAPDHAERVELAIDVRRALLAVPEEFRAVLILCDVQDLSYEDAAAALGVPIGTVKSRLHRGRVALGRLLAGERGDPARPSEGTVTP